MRKLLVIGGATVGVRSDSFITKVPIADYLHELARRFDSCVWVAAIHSEDLDGARLDPDLVRVIPLAPGRKNYPRSWMTLISLVRSKPYILYYLPNPYLPVLPLVRHGARRLVIYLANDYEMILGRSATAKWPGWSFLFRLSYEVPLRAADAVIARGKRLNELARRFNPNVYQTVPIGYVPRFANSKLPDILSNDQALRVLYVGKLLKSKGVDDLIKAMQFVTKDHPLQKVLLDIVGHGQDQAELEQLVTASGLEPIVTFHGWIGSERVIDQLYRSAHVLVVPTSTYPEGVPRVIDEALMRGVPVVATRVGGIPEEFTDDEVMLVEPSSPEQLARAIEAMIFDPQMRQRYLAGAQRRSALWAQYGSAAQQHARILLGELE